MQLEALERKKLELAKLRRAAKLRLQHAIDGLNPDARPTSTQDEILRDTVSKVFWVIAANRSGKSQVGARIVSWWFNGDHPHMTRPAEWGAGPLQILVVGRLGEQMESELWERKIRPFLREGEYKIVRIGNAIQRVENTRNGNRLIFISHHDAFHAREKVQAFTANVVWLDEMPDHAGLVTELLMRTLSSCGRLYATFTPLIRNEEIRKIVESRAPGARKFQLRMLDNPIYRGREAEVEAQVRAACASESEFRARMHGEWYHGDSRVCVYSAERNRVTTPPAYDPHQWRHLAVVDPSASGLTGLVVMAEDPDSGWWYVVRAKYLQGTAAYDLVDVVERELVGLRVTHRRCDCNPAGFYKEAIRRNLPWIPYTDKASRKVETLDQLNAGYLTQRLWLTDGAQSLEDEQVKATWSDTKPGSIVNSSSYHLLDCVRYGWDARPDFTPAKDVPRTEQQQMRDTWKRRKANEARVQRARVMQRVQPWAKQQSWYRSWSLRH